MSYTVAFPRRQIAAPPPRTATKMALRGVRLLLGALGLFLAAWTAILATVLAWVT